MLYETLMLILNTASMATARSLELKLATNKIYFPPESVSVINLCYNCRRDLYAENMSSLETVYKIIKATLCLSIS